MTIRLKLPCIAAALVAASCVLAAGAAAQSLSLSYKLDPVNTVPAQRATLLFDRCAALTWAPSLAAACEMDVIGRSFVPPPAPVQSDAGGAARDQTASAAARASELIERAPPAAAAAPGYELPSLGSAPSDARVVRMAGGREPLSGPARSVDLNFRFGSKFRMKGNEEGWEVYKQYGDVTSENRTQSRDAKAVAVELLFPFQ